LKNVGSDQSNITECVEFVELAEYTLTEPK